jgi:hypothetical protein
MWWNSHLFDLVLIPRCDAARMLYLGGFLRS